MKAGKHDRDLVGLERSLGFRSTRGISRQSNKDWLPIQAIVQGMKRIAKHYVDLTTGEIRQSDSLRAAVTDLFEEWAPTIWPDEDHPQPDWLEDPDPYKFEGRYPRRRHYNDPDDRAALRDLFYNLVVEKCCNYHSNQLQRARTSQRHSLDYENAAGETPRKAEPGSDSEMVDAEAKPPRALDSYHDTGFAAREAQFAPGEFQFRVFQDYGMPSSEPTVTTTEPAPTPTTAISWTPANMAPKEHTQEPTPSEAATSDRPDRPMRPKRKRPEPNEEMLPKKVSGDRKAKKPRWSQIIPLKVSPHHLARLADGDRIAPPMSTSPEETPPPQEDDTIMSNADDEHRRASNEGSVVSDAPATPLEEFAQDIESITAKRDPRSHSPRPPPVSAVEKEPLDARQERAPAVNSPPVKSPIERPATDQPLSNGTSRPQSARPSSESAPASRPATGHRENESSKPPPPSLTAPRKESPAMQELKWRPALSKPPPPPRSPLPSTNGLHTHHPGPVPNAAAPTQMTPGGRPSDHEADAVGGASKPPSQPASAASQPNSPRVEWHHIQELPSQPPRREPQPLTAPPHPASRSQTSLVEEILGAYMDSPTAREMLRKLPNLTRTQLEEMSQILAYSPDAQKNFDVFTAHVYGRRTEGPNSGTLAAALSSAMQSPTAPPLAPPSNSSTMPRFPPQHVLPSNGGDPATRPGAPSHSRRSSRGEDVDRILGDLVTCPTVKQVLQKKPNMRKRELKVMRDVLRDRPESRTNLEVLLSRLEEIDRHSERSPSRDHKEPPPAAEPPRGIALPSPRGTPGIGNPFNAFDSSHLARPPPPQQQRPLANGAESERAAPLSIIRSPPISEGSRRTDTPQHSIESNAARQPPLGAFRPAAPPTPAEIPHAQPQLHQTTLPNGMVQVHHGPAPFGRMPSVPSQGTVGPPQHPTHHHQQQKQQQQHLPQHHPQHHAMPGHVAPVGPARGLVGQQDVFAVRPPPAQHEKDHQRLSMPIRSTSMASESDVQTPRAPSMDMSMSPTPGAAATNSLEDVLIEINWARNLGYNDYLSMESCIHCKTAAEFFALIEAQMPDALQGANGNGNRIKEIIVKALTPLQNQGDGNMPRIKREESSGRMAMRKLIKKLRSQPADAEIELEFLVVWE